MKFDLAKFIQQLAAYVQAKPGMAHRAYAAAARRVREERNKLVHEGQKLEFQMVANKLDQMAAQAMLPEVEPEPFEPHSMHSDTLGDGVATEWDALIADIAASKVAASGTPNSDLVSAFLADRMHARTMAAAEITPDGTPSALTDVNVTPSSAKPGQTLFGASALVQFGGSNPSGVVGQFGSAPTAADQAQVCRWDGLENEAMVCTVSVSRIGAGAGATYPNTGVPATLQYRPYVRALFGNSRAAPTEVFADVGVGVQFTVTTAFLYVNVGMDAPDAGFVPGSMYLSGNFGFYGAGRVSPVNRTGYWQVAGNGQTKNFKIPAFATQIFPILTNQTAGNYRVDILDVAGNIIGSYVFNSGAQTFSIPIPGDADSVTLTNNSGFTANMRIIFGLSL